MIWKKTVVAAYAAFLSIFLIHLPYNVSANYNHSCPQISSCGTQLNISYPFRLKNDPPKCGDRYFELTCENNQTLILNLLSGKYLVRSINYSDFTIQLVDAGFWDGNCSSLPSHSIGSANFTYSGPYFPSVSSFIMFVSCETPQISPLYMDSSACLTTKNKYSYVVLNDRASVIGDSCAIDLIYPVNLGSANTTIITYMELHKFIANGFKLVRSRSECADCKGQGYCIYNSTTSIVTCSGQCDLTHVSSPLCFFNLLIQAALYIAYGKEYYILPAYCIILLAFFSSLFRGDFSRINVLYYAVLYPIVGILITPIVILVLVVRFICGGACVLALLIYKWRRRNLSMYDNIEEFLQNNDILMPIRYSYSQIKKITNKFEQKLGEGGFGSAYKGKLRSGYFVAVKILGKSKATGQDFMNEVATIGRIHHVNVVRLIGFCIEGSKRALVYEFMPNGSLEKYIFGREGYTSLSWEKVFEISLGIARGIEYLHRGCDMQILHFDIKPHNILLDENFIPKVSDFGLARLYPTTNNTVSLTAARGTIGYIAPELFYKNIGSVSYKVDVYSFAMMLMEMAGKRKNLDPIAEHSSQMYYPYWVHDQIVNGKEVEIEGSEEERTTTKKMMIVALWCIQMNPSNRPSMNKVLEMLEGNVNNLKVPPKPSLLSEETLENDGIEETNPTWSSSATAEYSESSSLIKSVS